MLKKRERLTKKEFDRFFSLGRRYQTDLFTLIYTPHPAFHGAVVVGKKLSKQAVVRNKIRRRIYGILYNLSRDNDLSGVFLILVKPAARSIAFASLREKLADTITNL